MRNRGRPLSRTMIVEHVWDMDYDGLTNIVDVYIRHLRSKIDERSPAKLIHTVRGIGYMLDLPERAAEEYSSLFGGSEPGVRTRCANPGCRHRAEAFAAPAISGRRSANHSSSFNSTCSHGGLPRITSKPSRLSAIFAIARTAASSSASTTRSPAGSSRGRS